MSYKPVIEANNAVVPDKPKMYAVIMHNDDYTTMDFVVGVLIKVFGKSGEEAGQMMMTVHKSGQCAVAVYSYDIACTKKLQAEKMAGDHGFPLKLSLREVMA